MGVMEQSSGSRQGDAALGKGRSGRAARSGPSGSSRYVLNDYSMKLMESLPANGVPSKRNPVTLAVPFSGVHV